MYCLCTVVVELYFMPYLLPKKLPKYYLTNQKRMLFLKIYLFATRVIYSLE